MSAKQSLRQEIAALEHELRRARDAQQRNPSYAGELRIRQLEDNIRLCQRDLASIEHNPDDHR